MNKKIVIFLINLLIFTISIAFGQLVVFYLNKDVGTSTEIAFISDIVSRSIEIVIALINFAFVIYIFNKDNKDKDKEKKFEYKLYWYKTFILPKTLEDIINFYNEVDKLIVDGNLDKDENNLKFTKMHNECKRNITDILKVVSPQTYTKIMATFRNMQDQINPLIFDNGTVQEMKAVTSEWKSKTIRILYEFEDYFK